MLTEFEKSLLNVVNHLQRLLKKAIEDREVALNQVAAISRELDDYIKANESLMAQLKEKQGRVAELERQIESRGKKRGAR